MPSVKQAVIGVLIAAACVGPLLCCGAGLYFAASTQSKVVDKAIATAAAKAVGTPQRARPVEWFTPVKELACATSPKFLDSSPLTSPANFVLVEPGTRVARVGYGGLTGRLYWELTAGGRTRIYVYRDVFDSHFARAPESDGK